MSENNQRLSSTEFSMTICDQQQCTGCAVCTTACNHQAISMCLGVNGHLYPVIDADKCVECRACVKLCPNNSSIDTNSPKMAYIATVQNPSEAKGSTSSGVASALSRQIIKEGGVVYGCSGRDIEHVGHIRIDRESDVDLLKGSKYVQSSLISILTPIKEDISKGIKVLFIGTPCQVAGITRYLHNPDNLITVDLVCHGVPSQQVLSDALHSYLPKYDLSTLDVRFREKEGAKSQYGLFVKDEHWKTVFHSTFPSNDYITGFLTGLFYRDSCYQCHYAKPERISDITLGDYWDHEGKVQIDNKNGGLSMLIVNTDKGSKTITESERMLNLSPSDYTAFIRKNKQLSQPMGKNQGYDRFKKEYPLLGFRRAAKRSLRRTVMSIKVNMLLNSISGIIHNILRDN